MNAPSGWVLVSAVALTSPALYAALVEGTMPIDVALTRFLLAALASWIAFSVGSSLFWPSTTQTTLPGPEPVDSPE